MFFDMSKEERERFKEKLCNQLNYGQLKALEKGLLLSRIILCGAIAIFFAGILFLTLGLTYSSLVFVIIGSTCIMLIVSSSIPLVKELFKAIKEVKKKLNQLIKEWSEGQLEYKEYKKFKSYF